jgi:hypothetical protein
VKAIAAKLVKVLVDIARAIGRAIVRRVVNLGIKRGIPWMKKRIAVFTRRRWRAIDNGWKLRERWLFGKIERWKWALAKVEKHRDALSSKAVKAYCNATGTALAKVPWYADVEKCPADVLAESPVGLRGAA